MFLKLGGGAISYNKLASGMGSLRNILTRIDVFNGYSLCCFEKEGDGDGEGEGEGEEGKKSNKGGGAPPNKKSAGSGDVDPDKKLDDYLNYEWSGLKYNQDAFNKVKDYYFNAGAGKVERQIAKGEHEKIKALTPEIEERLELADKAEEYEKALNELKKGNKLDPKAYNTQIIKELDEVKKREADTIKAMENDHKTKIDEYQKKHDGLRKGIIVEAISSRLRPKIMSKDLETDVGMKTAFEANVLKLAEKVELQENNIDFRIFIEEDGERVYEDKIVNNKSVPKTLDDMCEEFIESSPALARAVNIKSGAGTRPGSTSDGKEGTKLFKWQDNKEYGNFKPRPAD